MRKTLLIVFLVGAVAAAIAFSLYAYYHFFHGPVAAPEGSFVQGELLFTADAGNSDTNIAMAKSWLQTHGFININYIHSSDVVPKYQNFITFSGTITVIKNAFGLPSKIYMKKVSNWPCYYIGPKTPTVGQYQAIPLAIPNELSSVTASITLENASVCDPPIAV